MKKICILGKLETKYNAPFNRPEWEIWTMGKHTDHDLLPRIDKCFDIHKNPTNTQKGVVQRRDFPFGACRDLVYGNHFNNTMSYLIAYAILQGATDIAIYGARFDVDHNLRDGQRQNVRELLMFAKGKGIRVFDYDGVITKEFRDTENNTVDFDSDFDSDFDT